MKWVKKVKSWFFVEEEKFRDREIVAWLVENNFRYDFNGNYYLFSDSGEIMVDVGVYRTFIKIRSPYIKCFSKVFMLDDMGECQRKIEETITIAKFAQL